METQIFQDWYMSLTSYLRERLTNDKRKVVVIALSRKMPRLILWIMNFILDDDQRRELETLLHRPNCYYITEHAIPFVFASADMKNAEVLILDDMVITGETLKGVAEEILYITRRQPSFLSIYSYRLPTTERIPCKNISDRLPGSLGDMTAARSHMREFSDKIETSELPVDMEFPILCIDFGCSTVDCSVFDTVSEKFRKQRPKNRTYTSEYNGVIQTFTQIIENAADPLYNNDFAKFRLFRHGDGARLVCYAPNILGDRQVMGTDLFDDYHDLWVRILASTIKDTIAEKYDFEISDNDRLRHKVSHRLHQSLVVMANYLFSLSMMIRHKDDFADVISEKGYSAYLKVDDLALLIGPRLAADCIEILNGYYRDGKVSTTVRKEIRLPDMIVAEGYEGDYEYLSTSAVLKAKDAGRVVTGVFAMAYKAISNLNEKNLIPLQNLRILESYQSLYRKPNSYLRDDDGELQINKTVDSLIDEGYIVPLYKEVRDENDTVYWRRFFRPTHTAPLLLNKA